ncbi:MAG: hypothetical protein LQ340_003151 [Diploschistes diacapsis]|nr:MAG: hypothetical protein LQ340_003151 [Diploschistes diacapsis]
MTTHESSVHSKADITKESFRPPQYIVDLSLPPEQRFAHIAGDFREEIKALPALFDEIISQLRLIPKPILIFISRLLLRRLYDHEEHREIQGISKATGVELYLLIAFNVLLDLFMGCTSGGARVRDEAGHTKMLHFRTLDWGMDPLRKFVVQLNFVERAGGPVVATSVTYFGYVGVLTGLRKGLSVSLNFRPNHDRSTLWKRIAFRTQQWMVLLGMRRGIASHLRNCLLPKNASDLRKTPMDLARGLEPERSTAAYLTFSDGKTTVCMDKDHKKARITESSDFIFLVNHDYVDEKTQAIEKLRQENRANEEEVLPQDVVDEYRRQNQTLGNVTGTFDLVETSIMRRNCINKLWVRDRVKIDGKGEGYCVSEKTVVRWLERSSELCNDQTHYAVVMDPQEGQILWLERYIEPLEFRESVLGEQ